MSSWLPAVSGFNTLDSQNGFAGVLSTAVDGLAISGGNPYQVHLLDGSWLPAVRGYNTEDSVNGFAGVRGRVIDGVAVAGNMRYAVHLLGGGWLPAVRGFNTQDSVNGFAGVLGRAIDAVAVEGRTYGVSAQQDNTQIRLVDLADGISAQSVSFVSPPHPGTSWYNFHPGAGVPANTFHGRPDTYTFAWQGQTLTATVDAGRWCGLGRHGLFLENRYPVALWGVDGAFNARALRPCLNQWTDFPNYSFKHGCEICALAIAICASGDIPMGPAELARRLWDHHVPRMGPNRYVNSPAGGGSCQPQTLVAAVESLEAQQHWGLSARPFHGVPFAGLSAPGSAVVAWTTVDSASDRSRSTFPPARGGDDHAVHVRQSGPPPTAVFSDSWVGQERQIVDLPSYQRFEAAYNGKGKKGVCIMKISKKRRLAPIAQVAPAPLHPQAPAVGKLALSSGGSGGGGRGSKWQRNGAGKTQTNVDKSELGERVVSTENRYYFLHFPGSILGSALTKIEGHSCTHSYQILRTESDKEYVAQMCRDGMKLTRVNRGQPADQVGGGGGDICFTKDANSGNVQHGTTLGDVLNWMDGRNNDYTLTNIGGESNNCQDFSKDFAEQFVE